MNPLIRLLRWWLNLFTIRSVLVWFVGAVIATVSTMAYYSRRPPGTVLSIVEDTELTHVQDGKLTLVLRVDRHRYCEAHTDRWLFREEKTGGGEFPLFYWIGPIPTPPIRLGENTYGLQLTIPPEWDMPGVYYTAWTTYHCEPGATMLNPAPTQTRPMPINTIAGQ